MTAQIYGPQTDRIRRFLVQLAGLGRLDRALVVERHGALVSTPAWHAAENQLATTIERSGRTAQRDALSGPLLQLVRRADAPPSANDEETLATLDPVAEPALAALMALLVQDLLSADTAAILRQPFADVITE